VQIGNHVAKRLFWLYDGTHESCLKIPNKDVFIDQSYKEEDIESISVQKLKRI
jgi:hypothetical protein